VSRTDRPASAIGELQIRRFEAGDAPAVRRLHDLALTEAGVHFSRSLWDQDLDAIPATYLDDGGEFLVGLSDGRLVAMGALRHVTDTRGEVKRTEVDPAFQRRGYARLILAGLEDRARELGYRELRLDTTIRHTAAQHLFASAGYREVGRGQLAGVEVAYFAKSLIQAIDAHPASVG
jgi:ribosomal protein S18 acetylase RimI-like enzyme